MVNGSSEHLPFIVESPSPEDGHDTTFSKQSGLGKWTRRGHGPCSATTREKFLLAVIVLQAIVLLAVLLVNRREVACQGQSNDYPLLYSPAQSVIEYEVKSFTAGREHKTVYQGISKETDRAWGELYNHTIMKIPKSEAALLPNRTYPIKDEPGFYLAGLDVFHQLHCLNNVRRALHREHYSHDPDLDDEHVSHCVDTIRQSLMCNADISVNVWQWSKELSAVVGYSTQAHSCRNFDKLRDWARSRRVHKWIDTRLFVEDDLPDPSIIS